MKWLSSGLVFVNAATVVALLLGMLAGGVNRTIAALAFASALCLAVLAFLHTRPDVSRTSLEDPAPSQRRLSKRALRRMKARGELPFETEIQTRKSNMPWGNVWLWVVGAIFAMFALRSFLWLFFLQDAEWRIQSPNNLGDLALHITHIENFANEVSLWPDSPIYAFSKLRYPAGADLFNGLLLLLGLPLSQGFVWAGLVASAATFFAFWRWGGAFAVAGFLFNGGIAGFQLLRTHEWLDYQGVSEIAWKSIPLSMFVTQRGLLYAIPAGLLLLLQWRHRFFSEGPRETRADAPASTHPPLPFWIELSLYATMPLFHVHTFLALSLLLAFWFAIGDNGMRRQLLILVGAAFLPATFFVYQVSGGFHAGSVLGWNPGWVQTDGDFARPFFEFWFVNFGLWLPLALLLVAVSLGLKIAPGEKPFFRWEPPNLFGKNRTKPSAAFAFVVPAAVIFLLAVFVKTAPWGWDNTKVMIWPYFIVLPFLWRDLIAHWPTPVRVGLCVALFTSGFVSLFGGLAAGQHGFTLANREELSNVRAAVRQIPIKERFAAFPIYNHPLLLNGRNVVLGYPGHLWTQGFDYEPVRVKHDALMMGAPNWQELAQELHARYLFWGREEKKHYAGSTRPWERSVVRLSRTSAGDIYDLAVTIPGGPTDPPLATPAPQPTFRPRVYRQLPDDSPTASP